MASKTELESSVKELMALSESELEGELGLRLTHTAEELNRNKELTVVRATGPTVDRAALQSLPDFARKAAERFLKKFNRQMRQEEASFLEQRLGTAELVYIFLLPTAESDHHSAIE